MMKFLNKKWNWILGTLFSLFFLAVSARAGSLQVTWDAVANSSVAGYLIKYGTVSGNYSSQADVGNVNSYQLQNLTEGQLYYLVVAAYDNLHTSGITSTESSGLVLNTSNVKASLLNSSTAQIAWQTNKPADGQVEYWVGALAKEATPFNSAYATTHTETLSNLIPNTTYSYRVCSKDAGGATIYSAESSFQTPNIGNLINAGGAAVGNFSSDSYFTGGIPSQTANNIDLTGAVNPAPLSVYQSARSGSSFSYTIPNLTLGMNYIVRLHFAETDYSTVGQRTFKVFINSLRVLNNFDIVAYAGAANKAIIRQFNSTPNSQKQIVVQFSAGLHDLPKVCGLEVLPNMTSNLAINAGGSSVSSFVADTGFSGGLVSSANVRNSNTAAVVKAAPNSVYKSWRYDNAAFDYSLSKLNPGSYYLVRMHFAEDVWQTAGQRLFDVSLNGQGVLKDYDILANAGAAKTANVQEFIALADALGKIQVHLAKGSMDVPLVNGLETYPLDNFLLGINAGGSAIGDFLADAGFNGGTVSSTPIAIDTTGLLEPAPIDAYQSQREGNFTYKVTKLNPNGSYVVRLHFAESKWAGNGQRRFNVLINGLSMLKNFDVFQSAGAPYKAVVREFLATADSSGQITVSFSCGSADQAMVSAIEILN